MYKAICFNMAKTCDQLEFVAKSFAKSRGFLLKGLQVHLNKIESRVLHKLNEHRLK